jgi:hypothetical protein
MEYPLALPNQTAAYEDCEELFDRSFHDSVGARAQFPTEAAAVYMRLRMNHYRTLLRRDSCRTYDKTDPRYNKSIYDKLICRIRQDTEGLWWVYVERHAQTLGVVESLSEIEATDG